MMYIRGRRSPPVKFASEDLSSTATAAIIRWMNMIFTDDEVQYLKHHWRGNPMQGVSKAQLKDKGGSELEEWLGREWQEKSRCQGKTLVVKREANDGDDGPGDSS